MSVASVLRSRWAVWISAVVLPPLGLFLLWKRRSIALGPKLAASALILLWMPLGLWTAARAARVLGIPVERDGSGRMPMLSVRPGESHYRLLEENRKQQRAQPVESAAAVPLPAPAAAAKPEPSKPTPPPAPKGSAYWTDFRGPGRDGHYRQGPILTEWPEIGLKILWQQPVGGGYASFVIAHGKAFTIEQRRNREVAAAYDTETGRELWTNAWDGAFNESMGGPGPRATPTWHEGKLYVLGAEGELRCLDADTGKVVWRKNILEDNGAKNLGWAMSASPLVVDDKLITLPGGRTGNSVVAYHKLSGEPVWKSLSDQAAYVSPALVTVAGRRQVIVVTADRMVGIEPGDGHLLWEFPWKTQYDVNSAQPLVVADNRVFISSGYGHGAAVVELQPEGDKLAVKQVWSNTRMKNKFTSSVVHEGHIYGLDESILACLDARTGDLKWKGGRYGFGQLVLASGHLIVTTEAGEIVLVKATPEKHLELATFPAVSGKTWNHPAIADGKLFVRNTTEMACFRIAP